MNFDWILKEFKNSEYIVFYGSKSNQSSKKNSDIDLMIISKDCKILHDYKIIRKGVLFHYYFVPYYQILELCKFEFFQNGFSIIANSISKGLNLKNKKKALKLVYNFYLNQNFKSPNHHRLYSKLHEFLNRKNEVFDTKRTIYYHSIFESLVDFKILESGRMYAPSNVYRKKNQEELFPELISNYKELTKKSQDLNGRKKIVEFLRLEINETIENISPKEFEIDEDFLHLRFLLKDINPLPLLLTNIENVVASFDHYISTSKYDNNRYFINLVIFQEKGIINSTIIPELKRNLFLSKNADFTLASKNIYFGDLGGSLIGNLLKGYFIEIYNLVLRSLSTNISKKNHYILSYNIVSKFIGQLVDSKIITAFELSFDLRKSLVNNNKKISIIASKSDQIKNSNLPMISSIILTDLKKQLSNSEFKILYIRGILNEILNINQIDSGTKSSLFSDVLSNVENV